MEIYTVQKGDSVYKIAKKFGTTPSRIIVDNLLENPSLLSVGETLIITNPAETYTVERGDTLYGIAKEFGTTVNALWQNNPVLRGGTTIYPGQSLVIRFQREPKRTVAVNGYAYPYIDREVLRQTLPYLTYLSVFSYGLRENGTLIEPSDDEEIIRIAREYGTVPLMMLTSLTEDGTFSSELVNRILRNRDLWPMLWERVFEEIKRKNYGGLDVDFEYISPQLATSYVEFLEGLENILNRDGYPLFVSVAPKTMPMQPGLLYEGHLYEEIGAAADHVLLMTYEWGYTYGPPMAVSPLQEMERVVRYAVNVIPNEKLLLGMPNYAYDWPEPFRRGETAATSLSNTAALERAKEKNAAISYDEKSETPFYRYYEKVAGESMPVRHVVWFDNARSIREKLHLVGKYDLYGLSVWQIMRFFPAFWMVLTNMYDVLKLE